jgi:hypothetical protein
MHFLKVKLYFNIFLGYFDEILRVGISSVVTDKSLDLSNPHGNFPRMKNYAKDTKR